MRQWTYKLAKMDMRGGLKSVRKEIKLDDKGKKDDAQPEWAAAKAKPIKAEAEIEEEEE